MKERNVSVDVLKGILIILVVMGHYSRDVFHDVVFLFHMPLFFMISGFLQSPIRSQQQIVAKFKTLMLPYVVYILIDYLLIKRAFSVSGLLQILWGGRNADGVYWYITCYLAVLCLFYLLHRASTRSKIVILFVCGGTAVLESNLLTNFSDQNKLFSLLNAPGVPWNVDVALLATVYFAIGFYHKDQIRRFLHEACWQYDAVALALAVAFAGFCLRNYQGGQVIYYFDMKPVKYQSYVLSLAIPCGVGFVLTRLMCWLSRLQRLEKIWIVVSYIGQMTLPIMMMHVPLNTWKNSLGYDRWVYMLIGIGIPVIIVVVLGRCAVCRRLLGLPRLVTSSIGNKG